MKTINDMPKTAYPMLIILALGGMVVFADPNVNGNAYGFLALVPAVIAVATFGAVWFKFKRQTKAVNV